MTTSTMLFPAPDLGDDQILRSVCGLRPCRHGGLRLESEKLGAKRIIHNYGHGGCGVTISLGTAELAADLVDEAATPKQSVAVLGGGVVGFTTARELLRRGYRVTIYAERITHETTSVLAGALWLPVGVEFGNSPEQQARKERILIRSRDAFRSLDPERYGVEEIPVYEPRGSSTEGGLFDNGTIDEPTLIDSFPFACGAQPWRMFKTAFIHTPLFLDAVHDDVLRLGGAVVRRRIERLGELQALEQPVIVNCLALGSRSLFDDDAMYCARGVLVHLKPQKLGYCVHNGYKYMFPRKDALVLGGCFQPDRDDDAPDRAMIEEILNHHRRFFGQP